MNANPLRSWRSHGVRWPWHRVATALLAVVELGDKVKRIAAYLADLRNLLI